MKKKLIAGALAALALMGCITVVWAGSQSDPLVSLSYLNGAWLTDLKAYITQWVAQDTQYIYNEAVDKAEQSSTTADGWTVSSSFKAGQGQSGDTITLTTGSGLIWTSGAGAVSSGVLVDATTGTELSPGSGLAAGHRYLAAADTVVTASQNVQWMAEGKWRLGTGGAVVTPLPFTDVPAGQWYYDDVRFVVENGLFQGVSDTLFRPAGTMQRGMTTTVLHRLAGEPPTAYSPVFTDIPSGQWYTQGTIWCAQMGIVNGVGDGRFAPAQVVTRQQIAVMLYNYAVKTGQIIGQRGDLTAFSDAGSVAVWARDAVSWAVGVGILNGSGGKLFPEDGAQRAQVAAMLHRFQDWMDAQ